MSISRKQKLISLAEAARILGVSPWTLRLWDNKGLLKAVRIGSRKDRRYRIEDIEKIVKKGMA